MAQSEVYKLSIGIDVQDKGAESKLKKIEKQAEKLKKQKITSTADIKDNASSKLSKIEEKANKLRNKSISATATIKDEASSKLDKIKNNADKIANKAAKLKIQAQDEASKVIENVNNKLNGWLKSGAKKVISIGVAGAVAAGGFGIKNSIETFSNFESSMKNVQAITQATDKDYKTLYDDAKQLGATTAFSAKQSADAMSYLGMAGFKSNEIISAMPGLLDAAAASGEDLASVSDIVSDGLSAFKMKASDTKHFADVMAQTSANANTNIHMMGEAFKYVGSAAGAMGYSVEDASLAIGLMSNQGVKSSMAGTALKNMITNLASPSKEMTKVMSKYGLSLKNTDGSTKSLLSVMDMLREKFKGVNDVQKAADISKLFGKESMSGALAVINTGTEDYEKLRSAIYSADGASKKMADTKLDSLSGQWTILKSAVEGMNITLGEKLAPYAKQFVTWFTGKIPAITDGIVNVVDYISKHTADIKEIATVIAGVVGSITALNGIGSIGNSLSNISKIFSLFKGTEIPTKLSSVGLLAKTLPSLLSPAGIAITAAVGATAVGVHEYHKLMNESSLKAREDLDPIEKVMDSMSGNVHKSKKELNDLGLVYDDFGTGVSENFKTAAKDASKSILEMEMNINRSMKSNNLTASGYLKQDSIDKFKQQINTFTYASVNEMREKKSNIEKEFSKTFSLDGVVDSTEQGSLDALSEFYSEGENKMLSMRDSIYEFADGKIQEHGALLDSDISVIRDKLAEMKAIELEYSKAENARDQAMARNQFKNDASRVTGLEGASELLKSRSEQQQKTVDEINNNYSGTLAYYDSLISNENATDSQKEAWKAGKSKAKEERDKAYKQAREDWESDLETLYKQTPSARGMLDESTGAILKDSEIRSRSVMENQINSHNLSDVTKSGLYVKRNTDTGQLEQLYVEYDEVNKKIQAVSNTTAGVVGAASDTQKEKMMSSKEAMGEVSAALLQFADKKTVFDDVNNQIANLATGATAQLENIKTSAEGVTTGLAEIEGHQFEVTINADGVVESIQEVTDAAEEIPESKNTDITTSGTEQAVDECNQVENAVDSVPAHKSVFIDVAVGGAAISASISNIGEGLQNAMAEFQHNDSGTDNATAGLSTVNEKGWELADRPLNYLGSKGGNPIVSLPGGAKIRNHMDSMDDMRQAVKEEVAQQAPVQVYQPQLAMAGGGGNNISFGSMNINVNGSQDVEGMIQEAMTQFGNNLREAFSNIKR